MNVTALVTDSLPESVVHVATGSKTVVTHFLGPTTYQKSVNALLNSATPKGTHYFHTTST